MYTIQTVILLFVILFFNALGSVMLKKGVNKRNLPSDSNRNNLSAMLGIQYLSGKTILAGLLMQIVAFLGWLGFISHVALSVAFPLSSISNVTILIASKFMLNEHISKRRWLGVLCILGGIILIGR